MWPVSCCSGWGLAKAGLNLTSQVRTGFIWIGESSDDGSQATIAMLVEGNGTLESFDP